jgi:hypothetical protein
MLCAAFAPMLSGCGGGGGGGGGNATTRVRFIILDSESGDTEVEGATVTFGGLTGVTRTVDNANATNPVGSVDFVNAPVNTRTVVVTPVGGTAQTLAIDPALGAGDNGTIELFINIGQISGRVLLPDGQPAANAFVTISATGETLQVNANGTFLAQFVPKGPSQVFAVEGTATKTTDVTVGNGENAIGDIQLVDDPNPNPPPLPYTVKGTITVTGVGSISGTTAVLERNGVQIETATTQNDGTYGFYVPVGTYTVRAVRNGFREEVSAPFTITDPNQPATINLTMQPL